MDDKFSFEVMGTLPAFPEDSEISRPDAVIWAAGFFDGEGCVSIGKQGSGNQYLLKISAVQTKTDAPLRMLRNLFGGCISEKRVGPRCAACKSWSVAGEKAALALEQMLPYLLVKNPQALLGIKFQRERPPTPGRKKTSPDEIARRVALKEAMSQLNKRGIP